MGEKEADWGRLEIHKGHGIWVPKGMTAAEIEKATDAVSDRFDIDKHTARSIAITVMQAVRSD